ncbi:MAG: TIR domain-containing protein [Chloroflexi bacterium]|nr:TIR domain-containing protein [Chloroflexota bacterium]
MTTSMQAMPRIFISHSSKDNDFGLKLVQDLRQALGDENAVWYDAKGGLHGGDMWWDKIKEELRERFVFLVILSPDALVSPWVTDEIRIAWRQKNSQGKQIIPVLWRPCDMPDDLDTLQVVSFVPPRVYEDAFNELLMAVGLPVGMEARVAVGQPDEMLAQRMTAQIEDAYTRGSWQEVIQKVDHLAKQVPGAVSSEMYRLQALAFQEEGEWQSAEEAFNTALALVSDPEPRLILLEEHSRALTKLGMWSELLRDADEAMNLEPNNPQWITAKDTALAKLGPQDASAVALLSPPRPKINYPETRISLTYRGHTGWVHGLAWSPDSKYIASASADRTVQVWEATSGKPLFTLTGHQQRVNSVAWSPDGTQLATASNDKTVQIWDTTTGVQRFTYRGHHDWVNSVAWSPDGMLIATASDDKTIQIWDAATGHMVLAYRDHTGWVNAAAWSPDGKLIASASSDKTVRVWDSSTGGNKLVYTGHKQAVNTLLWSPRGLAIASASNDKTVHMWDPLTGNHSFTYTAHKHPVLGLARSPHARRIASASDKTLHIWYAATGTSILNNHSHTDLVRVIAWSPNGRYIASAGDDRTVQVRSVVDAGVK